MLKIEINIVRKTSKLGMYIVFITIHYLHEILWGVRTAGVFVMEPNRIHANIAKNKKKMVNSKRLLCHLLRLIKTGV